MTQVFGAIMPVKVDVGIALVVVLVAIDVKLVACATVFHGVEDVQAVVFVELECRCDFFRARVITLLTIKLLFVFISLAVIEEFHFKVSIVQNFLEECLLARLTFRLEKSLAIKSIDFWRESLLRVSL